MSAIGAQRKHGTLPTDFRSPSENGPSRCGHLTARFAPKQPFAVRMRLCADSYLRDLAVDQVSANGRIRRCAGATCEIACFGFWPTADVAQTRQGVGTAAGKETSHCEPPRPSAATQTLAVAPRHPAALQRSLDCPWHTSRAEIVRLRGVPINRDAEERASTCAADSYTRKSKRPQISGAF